MKGPSDAANAVLNITTSGDRDVESTSNSIENLADSLKGLIPAAEGATRATDRTSEELRELAVSSSTASGGLSGLQAQLAATATAEEALEDSTDDLSDTLRNLVDDGESEAALQAVEAIADDLSESFDELDDADPEVVRAFDELDLDESQVKSLLRGLTGIEQAHIDADKYADEMGEFSGALASVEHDSNMAVDSLRRLEGSLDSLSKRSDGDIIDSTISQDLEDLTHVGERTAEALRNEGFESVGDILQAEPQDLEIPNLIGKKRSRQIMGAAQAAAPRSLRNANSVFDILPSVFGDTPGAGDSLRDLRGESDLDDEIIESLLGSGYDTIADVLEADRKDITKTVFGDELAGFDPQDTGMGEIFEEGDAEYLRNELDIQNLEEFLTAPGEQLEQFIQDRDQSYRDEFIFDAVDQLANTPLWKWTDKDVFDDSDGVLETELGNWINKKFGVTDADRDTKQEMLKNHKESFAQWLESEVDSERIPDSLKEEREDWNFGPDDLRQDVLGRLDQDDVSVSESQYDVSTGDIWDTLRGEASGFKPKQARKQIWQTFDDREIAENLMNIVDLMDEYDEIREAIQGSGTIDAAIKKIDDLDEDNLLELQDALLEYGDDLDEVFDDTSKLTKHLGGFSDGVELQREIEKNLDANLDDAQTAILSDITGDLNDLFVSGDQSKGINQPVTRETLSSRLIQEYLDTDRPRRQQHIRDLIDKLHSGELGIDQSIAHTDSFLSDIEPRLRSNLVRQGMDENTAQRLAGGAVGQLGDTEFHDISSLIDEGGVSQISDISQEVLDGTGIRSQYPDAPLMVGDALEDVLQNAQYKLSAQTAPGLLAGLGGTDSDILDALPGSDVDRNADNLSEQIDAYLNNLDHVVDSVEDAQKAATSLRGDFGGFGNKNRGIIGHLLGRASQSDRVDPRYLKKIGSGVEQVADGYDKLVPWLDATSINLGPLNVSFQNVALMMFRMVALFGPLIAGLGGLASAAIIAAGALGSFVAVGAIGFLEQMEQQMAGVNNKSEAMQKLMQSLGDMAWRAVKPLRDARLADGRSGIHLFVDAIQGGLVLLNRMSAAMAEIVSMPIASKQLARLTDALFNNDGSWVPALKESMRALLPLLTTIFITIIEGLPGFIQYMTRIADDIGPALVKAMGNMAEAFRLTSKFGTGFLVVVLNAIAALGWLITQVNKIPGPVGEAIFVFGGLVGVLNVVNASLGLVQSALVLTAKGLLWTASAANTASAAMTRLWTATLPLSAVVAIIAAAVLVFIDLAHYIATGESFLADWIPHFESWESWTGTLANTLVLITGIVSALLTMGGYAVTIGEIISVIVIGFKIAASAVLAIVGALTGVVSLTGVLVGLLVLIAVVAADFLYWVATGESLLGNWVGEMEGFYRWIVKVGDQIERAVLNKLERAWEIIQKLPGIGPEKKQKGSKKNSNSLNETSKFVDDGGKQSGKVSQKGMGSQPMPGGGAAASAGGGTGGVVVNVTNNGVIGEKNFRRMIRREAEDVIDSALSLSPF